MTQPDFPEVVQCCTGLFRPGCGSIGTTDQAQTDRGEALSIGVQDRKKLWSLARNKCAYAQCTAHLVENLASADGSGSTVVVVGEEAHIRSGSVGGPRNDGTYDATLIDTYENLILLCPTHHTIVDKDGGRGFSVRDLVQMRRTHEQATAKFERLQRVYAAYLADQWRQDNRVLFEAVDLHGPSVDSMFVDVPIAAPASSEAGQIVAAVHANAPVDLEARDPSNELVSRVVSLLLVG